MIEVKQHDRPGAKIIITAWFLWGLHVKQACACVQQAHRNQALGEVAKPERAEVLTGGELIDEESILQILQWQGPATEHLHLVPWSA